MIIRQLCKSPHVLHGALPKDVLKPLMPWQGPGLLRPPACEVPQPPATTQQWAQAGPQNLWLVSKKSELKIWASKLTSNGSKERPKCCCLWLLCCVWQEAHASIQQSARGQVPVAHPAPATPLSGGFTAPLTQVRLHGFLHQGKAKTKIRSVPAAGHNRFSSSYFPLMLLKPGYKTTMEGFGPAPLSLLRY